MSRFRTSKKDLIVERKIERQKLLSDLKEARSNLVSTARLAFAKTASVSGNIDFRFDEQRRKYVLAGLTGEVQQIEPNNDTTAIVFTVDHDFYMDPHNHPFIIWESIMVLEGRGYLDLETSTPGKYERKQMTAGSCIRHDAKKLHGFGGKAGIKILVIWYPRLPTDTSVIKPSMQ